MQRSLMFALLTMSLLLAAPAAPAQRAGGGSHGGGFSGGAGGMNGGHGFGNGNGFGFTNGNGFGHNHRGRGRGYGRYGNYYGAGFDAWGYPYWDDDIFWDDGFFYPEAQANLTPPPPAPPVVVMRTREDRAPAPPVLPPKMIEVPQTKEAAVTAKPQPATLFVFANGERLESRRYTLTANSLCVEIGRQQRTVPLDKLDLDATIAANRERGIDLQVPTDSNHIFLSF